MGSEVDIVDPRDLARFLAEEADAEDAEHGGPHRARVRCVGAVLIPREPAGPPG
ncbi:MAG: hypothetical protein GXP49_05615, partial [Deltaproteobacteria bacterium]|nr:hypothetical protein [Deltaproteobacteria bacterium]